MRNNMTLTTGSFARHTAAPAWMFDPEVQVIDQHTDYVIGQCRENRGKGWANTLAIFKKSELEATGSVQPINPQYSRPGPWGREWVNKLAERIDEIA